MNKWPSAPELMCSKGCDDCVTVSKNHIKHNQIPSQGWRSVAFDAQLAPVPVLIKFTRLTGQNYPNCPNYPNRVIDLVIQHITPPPPNSPGKDG